MTEAEFLAMEPREQDAAVAVAQEPRPEGVPVFAGHISTQTLFEAYDHTSWVPGFTGGAWAWVPKEFTSLIATAWELVEEMKADGFDGYCVAEGEVYFSKGDAHNEHVLSLFGASSPPVEDWSAATTALHISIAYLKAKGAIQ